MNSTSYYCGLIFFLLHRFSLYIEAVASDMFGAGASGMINPPDPSRYYSISVAEVAVFDRDVYNLLMDLTIIYDMAKVCMCVLRLYFFIALLALVVYVLW